MDDGLDSNLTNGNDGGDTIDVSDDDVVIEISADELEIPVTTEEESSLGNPEKEVSVVERSSGSVSVTDDNEYVESVLDVKCVDTMIDNLNAAILGIKGEGDRSEDGKVEAIRLNVNRTILDIGISNMTKEEKVDSMKRVYASVPEDARRNIYVPSDVKYLRPDLPFDEDGRPQYSWGSNNGFEGEVEECQLKPGQVIDRYGDENGAYVCEVKNGVVLDYDSRALPYEENPGMYHQYEITRDFEDFKSEVMGLSVEKIVQMEIQRDMDKPEEERRSMEQIQEDAEDRYDTIMFDVAKTNGCENAIVTEGFEAIGKEELVPTKGKIAENFSYVDSEGVEHKRGGGEQIYLPASVDTLIYLGYMKEKK